MAQNKFTETIVGNGYTLAPSPYSLYEAVLRDTDERGYRLAEAVGCIIASTQDGKAKYRLTPVRARKWAELYEAGFYAGFGGFHRDRGPVYRKMCDALNCARSL